jgi:prefoldin subunit 5
MEEQRLRKIEDSILLIGKEIEAINKTLIELNSYLATVGQIRTDYSVLQMQTDELHERYAVLAHNYEGLQKKVTELSVNSDFVTKVRGLLWKIGAATILAILGAGGYIVGG